MHSPEFNHDCRFCKFMGTDKKGRDWYICDNSRSFARTILIRYGNEAGEYISTPIAATVEMTNIERLAFRMGLSPNDDEISRYGKRYIRNSVRLKNVKEDLEVLPDIEDENLLGKCDWTIE